MFFLRLLARARAALAHAAVRSALRAAYVSRWSSIIAVAAQRALASSLLELPLLLPAKLPCIRSCKMSAGSTPLRPADFRPGPKAPGANVGCSCSGTALVLAVKKCVKKAC